MLKFLEPILKYTRVSYYSTPESVPTVSIKGMIYMQLSVFLFILIVALSQGRLETI